MEHKSILSQLTSIKARIEASPRQVRAVPLAVGIIAVLATGSYVTILPFYPGHASTLFMFAASGSCLLGLAVFLRSSFFLVVFTSFLTLGFLLKAVASLSLGVALIEPVGGFNGSAAEWDSALGFATAGQLGSTAAVILSFFAPSNSRYASSNQNGKPILGHILFAALAVLLVLASCVYALNYQYTLLRIGYPLGIDIHPRIYAVLAFILTWGALLGGLALAQWLIELGRLRHAALILIASYLGFLSSLTMGSRVQFLLYILASMCVVSWRWRDVQRWGEVICALLVAGVLFVVSIAIVSIERNYAFEGRSIVVPPPGSNAGPGPTSSEAGAPKRIAPPPNASSRSCQLPSGSDNAPPASPPGPQRPAAPECQESLASKFAVVTSKSRLAGVLQELRNLFVMRWVGLEGVLTTEGAERELGRELFLRGLAEDPATGKNGIYQKMAGDPYGNVEVFTFLTLPGPIGVASYSGSAALIFGFMFSITIAGHLLEWFAYRVTGNIAVGAVSGVSLAYLGVQMGFPWTLFIYAIELCLACSALGLFWLASRRLAASAV